MPLDFTISWTPITGAEQYELQIVERIGHDLYSPEDRPPVNFDTILFANVCLPSSDTSYQLTGTKRFREYLCRIRAINSEYSSEWSSDFWVTDNTSSVADEQKENELSVSPNPASDYIDIRIPKNSERIDVFNIFGEKVLELNFINNSERIRANISRLPKGIYIVRAGNSSIRFVKL